MRSARICHLRRIGACRSRSCRRSNTQVECKATLKAHQALPALVGNTLFMTERPGPSASTSSLVVFSGLLVSIRFACLQRWCSPACLSLSVDSIRLLWDIFFGPCGTGDGLRRQDRSQAQLSDPFSPGLDQCEPFKPESSGATTEFYRVEPPNTALDPRGERCGAIVSLEQITFSEISNSHLCHPHAKIKTDKQSVRDFDRKSEGGCPCRCWRCLAGRWYQFS
ncbi:hypothetical protein Baya_4787 [Bagarius yarrelli]|uniref:Uncharacterized protein n=1 Tax=Bagarius yarrelli TaxID=175774 RepID=A0A556TTJ8_BAGYA|nr:hypothetical protein Baya_4787 [Bagarius yarrelli]